MVLLAFNQVCHFGGSCLRDVSNLGNPVLCQSQPRAAISQLNNGEIRFPTQWGGRSCSPASSASKTRSRTSPPATTARPDLSEPLFPLWVPSATVSSRSPSVSRRLSTRSEATESQDKLARCPANECDTVRHVLRRMQLLHGKQWNLVGGKGLSCWWVTGETAHTQDISKAAQPSLMNSFWCSSG